MTAGRLLAVALLLLAATPALGQDRFLTMASETATDNSGLFEEVLPRFTERTGIAVRVIAVGSGQALSLARSGDADVLLLNDREGLQALVEEGHGLERLDVMYNDLVIVGPVADPAAIRRAKSAADALFWIASVQAAFVSPGDGGGVHAKEQALWASAKIDPVIGSGGWYRDSGLGIAAALHAANDLPAYSLADRASWIAFANRQQLALLFDRDPALINHYGLLRLDPRRHPHTKAVEAETFAVWLTSPEGQSAIAGFRLEGQQLFFPKASPATQ